MAKTKKPTHQLGLPFPPARDALHQEGRWLWIPPFITTEESNS